MKATTKFELPQGYVGIEDVVKELKEWGRVNGRERLIGLRRDGKRMFDVLGEEHCVAVPEEWIGKCDGVFLIHCHPTLTTPLSWGDLTCIEGVGAAGNMAVCCQDDTISWTHGLKWFDEWVYWALNELSDRVCKQHSGPLEERAVIIGADFLHILAMKGLLRDLHIRWGEKAKATLEKYHVEETF